MSDLGNGSLPTTHANDPQAREVCRYEKDEAAEACREEWISVGRTNDGDAEIEETEIIRTIVCKDNARKCNSKKK